MWLEQRYIGLITNRLERLKRRGDGSFNFRCPICLDSEKHKNKARGYLLPAKGTYWFYCHNCGGNLSFEKFLRLLDGGLYRDFIKEKLVAKGVLTNVEKEKVEKVEKSDYDSLERALSDLRLCSALRPQHSALRYLRSRKLPQSGIDQLYYIDDFKRWTNSIIPGKFEEPIRRDEPRIVIPFKRQDGKWYGFTGRSLDPEADVRYVAIIIDREEYRLFGMDQVDFNRRNYLLEGAFDSMFIPNAFAGCGSDLSTALVHLPNKTHTVVVNDNEPRNKEVVDKYEKTIERGYPICIWPSELEQKDVNSMVLAGMTPEQVHAMIDDNTYVGMKAKLALVKWRKT